MIPKIIHYCWFGGNPLPPLAIKCINSWKKYCPDYEIIEWNESNYDFTKIPYMRQAYEAKKWGFVPDYARLDIIYEHGGIYLDTDVELLKKLDELLTKQAFMGFENEKYVAAGLGFGAKSKNPIIKEMMDYYLNVDFINEDGSLNLLPSPHYTTTVLINHGLRQDNTLQEVGGVTIYPTDYFCPKDYETGVISISPNTYTIHHYTASWHTENEKKFRERRELFIKLFGKTLGIKISNHYWTMLNIPILVRKHGIFGFVNKAFRTIIK